jgi:hypothetical protein
MSPGTPVYSTTKTDHHDITKLLLKMSLNTKNNQWNCFIVKIIKKGGENKLNNTSDTLLCIIAY